MTEFHFTNDEWREYQAMPEQGYSRRGKLEFFVNRWLAEQGSIGSPVVDLEKLTNVIREVGKTTAHPLGLARGIVESGIVRSESEVKAEALEEAANELPVGWTPAISFEEWLTARAREYREGKR